MKQGHRRKVKSSTFFLVTFLSLLGVATSDVETNRWEFNNSTNYIYDFTRVEVVGGQAQLVLQAQQSIDGSFEDYTNGSLSDVTLGADVGIRLAGAPGIYPARAVFASRVLRGKAGNTWKYSKLAINHAETLSIAPLIGYYRLDAQNWRDQITGGNGTTFGTPGFTTDAIVGSHAALLIGAQNDYVILPNNPFTGLSEFTTAFWFNLDTFVLFGGFLCGYTSGSDQFRIQLTTSPNLRVLVNTTAGAIFVQTTAELGKWTHLALSWDGSGTGDGVPRLFINGVLKGSGAPVFGAVTFSGDLALGTDPEGVFTALRSLDGRLDDLMMFDEALTVDQVERLYDGQSELFRPVEVRYRSGSSASNLVSRTFVGPDGTTNSFYVLDAEPVFSSANFSVLDSYAQYELTMLSDPGLLTTPLIRSIGLVGDRGDAIDNTRFEFDSGSHGGDIAIDPPDKTTPYIGSAKLPNGGYVTNGLYVSPILDAGEDVTWERLTWSPIRQQSVSVAGLVALYHLNGNWDDATTIHSVFNFPNADFTPFAKLGARSAIFDGASNYVEGFSNLGTIRTVEFWINALNPDTPIMKLFGAVSIEVVNGAIALQGYPTTDVRIFVNGSSLSPHLLTGWNHVALVFDEDGLPVDSLVVGQVAGVGFFQGLLDELVFYSSQITDAVIGAHFSQGNRRVAGRAGFQVTSGNSLTNFVGPGGSPSVTALTPPFTLLGVIANQRFLRYRIFLDGDGSGTPAVGNVVVETSPPSSLTFTNNTAAEFALGEFVDGSSALYGDRMSQSHRAGIGPVNVTPFAPSVIGIWHLDDADWSAGASVVINTIGAAGDALGDVRPTWVSRVGTRAALFDGDGDYLDNLVLSSALQAGDYAISIWFKTVSAVRSTLITTGAGADFSALEINSDGSSPLAGRLTFVADDGSGPYLLVSDRLGLNDGGWHNAVMVRNSDQLLLYVDGRRSASLEVPGLGGIAASSKFVAGANNSISAFYEGSLDEIVVYNRAITDGEIGNHVANAYKTESTGVFESRVLSRPEPSIWEGMAWTTDGPYGKPLGIDDSSLVALWHMEDTVGPIQDAIVASPDSGAVSSATFGESGRFGSALGFDSSSSANVTVSDSAGLQASGEKITIEAWVYLDGALNRAIIDKRSGGNGYALITDGTGAPQFAAAGATATGFRLVRAKKWTHLAGTYDGAELKLYVDGQVASVTNAGPGSLTTAGTSLKIGSTVAGGSYVDGRIDEVAIHSRALNPEEVLDHYRAGAVSLKFQARTSFTNGVFGDYLGPGGTNTTFFVNSAGENLIGSIPNGLFFQYKATFETEDHNFPPPLHAVNLTVSGYPISNPTIEPTEAQGYPFPGHLLSWAHLRTNNPNTAVKYQISGDSGTTPRWFYWDGSAWSEEDPFGPDVYTFQANDVTDIDSNIDTFYTDIYNKTGGLFRFKAFLHSGGENQAIIDWVELVSAPGAINIVAPDGGEDGALAWIAGVPHDIVWDHTITVTGTISIEYSLNAGQSWAFVNNATDPATNVPVTNLQHVWNTPATESTNVLVRIISNEDAEVFDISDDIFTLREGLQIVDNNGGLDIWYIGETNTIAWRKSFLSPPALLEFNGTGDFVDTNATVLITPSSIGVDALNTYDWITPTTNELLVSETGKLRVRPVAAGLFNLSDESDETFVMAGAVVTAPRAGVGVKKDAVYDLQWVSAGMGPNVILEIQDFPGGAWNLIDASAPNASGLNHYNWTPTNTPTETARIRISSTNDPRARGLTEDFTIAAIELLSPLGDPDLSQSEVWLQNTTQTIAWISGGAADFVHILFSINSGQDYILIASNFPNINGAGTSNTYSWLVEQFPSETVRVRLEDAVEPNNLFSESPYDFQIAGLKVLWPNGPNGEAFEWLKGISRTILWEENAVGQFGTIEYSDDGGVSWLTVVSGPILLNTEQAYTPTNPSVRGMVRITADNPIPFTNVLDTSDAFFDVAGIRAIAPSTGSEFTILETNPVTFVIAATRDADSHAPIFYSGDGGANFDPTPINAIDDVFSEDFPGFHTFSWPVEDFRRPSLIAVLKIQAGTYVELTKPFTVRGITFDAPVSSTIWAPGLQQVDWSSAGLAADAQGRITYAFDRGDLASFTNDIAGLINIADLTVNWNVPPGLGPSTTAVLRIEITASTIDPGDIGYSALSQTFTLQGIRVFEPGATNRFGLGETHTVSWEAASGGAFVDLYYSPDGGVSFDADAINTFVPSQDGFNSDAWLVELDRLPSTNARVKVVSQAFPLIEGLSAPFMMRGIKVLRPRSTDILAKLDLTNIISWAAVNDVGPGTFDIFYVVDGSVTGTVATTFAGNSLNWSIPNEAISDDVRIIVTDGIFSGTSDVFRVVLEPTIDIIAPAPGSFLPIGTDIQLRWARGGSVDNDFTAFWVFGGATNTITTGGGITFDSTNNIFSLTWSVPDNRDQIRFGVQHNTLLTVNDLSEEVNIVGQFRVLQPTTGSDFYARRSHAIVWETLGSVDFVDVYYSLSAAHEADSWVKINTTPIANNFTPFPDPSPYVQKTFPWTVVNTRTALARVRVQEAAYTNKFDSGVPGPYADSDGNFNILYYTVYWEVFDVLTTNPLDRLTVVDSSGWSAANQATTNGISNDYPWGTFTTEFYRQGFFDASILFWDSENLNISVPGPRVWTQTVFMARSEVTESYRVLADFSYNPSNQFFTINSWLERGGVILEQPSLSTITIFDAAGATVDVLSNSSPQSNGVFWTYWDASSVPALTVLFAKVEIENSGFKYNSGVTFTLDIPITAQIDALLQDVVSALTSNVLGPVSEVLTNVAGIVTALGNLQGTTDTGFSNVIDIARQTTNLIADVGKSVDLLTTNLIDVVGPKLDSMTNRLLTIEADTRSSLSRILSRPDAVALNSTNTILYKSRAGYDPGMVKMEVFNVGGGGAIDTIVLSEVIGGLYQGTYTADWGVNTFKVTCSDPGGGSDSMALRVTLGDLYALPTMLGLVSNQLDDVELKLINIAVATDSITNHVLPMIDLLATNLDFVAETLITLTNAAGINFAIIEANTAKLTNQLATLSGLDLIGAQVALLTNALGAIGQITNVSELVNSLTNSLGSFSFDDIAQLKAGVESIQTNIAAINWNQVTDIQGNVSNINDAVFGLGGMAFDLDVITGAIHGVSFSDLALNLDKVTNTLSGLVGVENELDALTNALLGVDFALMKAEVSSLTNSDAILAANFLLLASDVTSLTNSVSYITNALNIAVDKLCDLTNAVAGVDFSLMSADLQLLTNEVFRNNGMSQRVDDIWNKLIPADFDLVMTSLATTTNKLNALDALGTIGDQIISLSNSLDTIIALTNLSSQVASIDAQLGTVDFDTLEQTIIDITNTLSQLTALQQVSDAISNLSSTVTALTNLSEISSTVVALGAELLGAGLDTIAADVSDITNQLSQLASLPLILPVLEGLTNQLDILAAITSVVPNVEFVAAAIQGIDFTNLQARVATIDQNTTDIDWSDIDELKLEMDLVTNVIAGLGDLPALVGSLSNTLQGVSGLTNIARQVDALHTALLAVNFLSIEQNLNTVTGQLSEIDWSVVLDIRDDVAGVTNQIAAIGDLEQIAADLVNLTNAFAQLAGVTNIGAEIADITNALRGLDWDDVRMIKADVQRLTNKLINVDFSTLGDDISDLTNAIAQLSQFTNMPGQVDALAGNLLGINFVDLTNDVGQMATDLANFDWNVILGLATDMSTVTNELGALGDLTGLADAIAGLTNAVDALAGVTNIGDQVSNIEQLVEALDFTRLTNDIDSITQKLTSFDWNVILNMQSQLDLTTNIIGGITGLPGLIDEIQGLTNSIGDLQSLTNLSGQVAAIEAAVGGLDFAALIANVQSITNELDVLNLSILDDISSGIGDITNSLAQLDLSLITSIHGTVAEISNILSQADFDLLTSIDSGVVAISNELSILAGLEQVASDLSNLTNALAQLGNITNLGARLGDVTNALQGLDWRDITELKAEMDDATNALARLAVLLPVPGVLDDLTNTLVNLDWDDILELKREMDVVTNDIAVLSGLGDIADALNGLSNSLSTIVGITNLSVDISSITNALQGLSDVGQIRDDVALLTNTFASLGDVSGQLASVSNVLSSLAGVTNIESQLTLMTTQLVAIADCVITIKTNVDIVVGAVLELTNLTAVSSELAALGNAASDLVMLTGITANVNALATTFASANWNDVTAIDTTLNTLSASLAGLGGVDLTTFDPGASLRNEATLMTVATRDLVDEIETLMGDLGDPGTAGTLFGRINDINSRLGSVGADAKNTALRSQTAKSRAGAAASGIRQLQSDIDEGDPAGALRTIREVQALLKEAKNEIDLIPKDEATSTIYKAVRGMADSIEQLAATKGFDFLLNWEPEPEDDGTGAGGIDPDLAKKLNENVQEVRSGMEFMQKLLDEMRFEPVVQETLLATQ